MSPERLTCQPMIACLRCYWEVMGHLGGGASLDKVMPVFVRESIVVKRHHDGSDSYKETLTWG